MIYATSDVTRIVVEAATEATLRSTAEAIDRLMLSREDLEEIRDRALGDDKQALTAWLDMNPNEAWFEFSIDDA